MNAERWERIKTIFARALELPASERGPFLDLECGADAALRSSVDDMLASSANTDAFLEPESPDQATINSIHSEGQYRIIRRLGSGGMGVVFLAQEESAAARQVAIKVVRPGLTTQDVVSRFRSEQRVLGLMDHPGIARIHHAGETSGGARYFVMEYVEGAPIVEYCGKHAIPATDRLELFIRVCDAVDHAHRQNIVHRDLKPSNVLIKNDAGTLAPKIIDFGISKALNDSDHAHGNTTQLGIVMGTPYYMSPEQKDPYRRSIGPQSDVYSLGVLLYRLICGTLPFGTGDDSSAAGSSSPQSAPYPTKHLSSLSGEELARVATNCQTTATELRKLARRGLDSIIARSLQEEIGDRYATAGDLRDDLKRLLSGDRVVAPIVHGIRIWDRLDTRKRRSVFWAGVIVAFVASVLAWYAFSRGTPSHIEITSTGFSVLNEEMKHLWSKSFAHLHVYHYEVNTYEQIGTYALIHDVTGNGALEVLFVEHSSSKWSNLHCYDSTGELIWTHEFRRQWTFVEPGTETPRRFGPFAPAWIHGVLDFEGERVIVVHAINNLYPNSVKFLDPESGATRFEYLHPGHLKAIQIGDIDNDDQSEVLLGGHHNPGRGNAIGHPSLAILDPPFDVDNRVSGADRNYFGPQNALESSYILFAQPWGGTFGEIIRMALTEHEQAVIQVDVETNLGIISYRLRADDLQPFDLILANTLSEKAAEGQLSIDHLKYTAHFETAPDSSTDSAQARFVRFETN